MEDIDVLAIIGIVSTFISLLLAFFIVSVESKNKISNVFFATFLVLNAIEFSGWFSSLLFDTPNNLLVFKTQLSHLTMPVLYLYIVSVSYSDFKLQWKHLWHSVPFIIANVIMIPRFYLSDTDEKIVLYRNYNDLFETIYMHVSLHIQSTLYIIAGFIVLKRAKKIFIENYSSSTIQTYKWLFQLLIFMATLYAVAFVKNLFKYFGDADYFDTSQIIMSLVILCFVCWYVLKALKYPNLFSGVDSKTKLSTDLLKSSKEHPTNEEIEEITSFMKSKKPYLNPSLTIRKLAEDIDMNARDVSLLINLHLNKHFFDFVNEYRIEEAKELLKNPAKKDHTVLEILYEVGFNSKSSFNTAFKKHTGLTPTQYRKNT